MHPVLSVNRLPTLFRLQKFVEMSYLLMILFIVVDLFLYILFGISGGSKNKYFAHSFILNRKFQNPHFKFQGRGSRWSISDDVVTPVPTIGMGRAHGCSRQACGGTVLIVSWEDDSKAAITRLIARIRSSVVVCEGCLFSLPHANGANSPGTPPLCPKAGQGPVVSWQCLTSARLSKGREFLIYSIF